MSSSISIIRDKKLVRRRNFEKCARRLCLNSPSEAVNLVTLLSKIVSNCIAFPDESTYFHLKLSNSVVKSRILGRAGGLEYLIGVGFVVVEIKPNDVTIEDHKELVLDRCISMKYLRKCVDWLQNALQTCLDMMTYRSSLTIEDNIEDNIGDNVDNIDDEMVTNQPCAMMIVQILLPTNQSIVGGFMSFDTLEDVLSFVRCYFVPERHNVLGLRSVGSREAITTADNLDMTLASLRWPSRVKLIATVWNEEDAERSLTQHHRELQNEFDEKHRKDTKIRIKAARLEAAKRDLERAETLSSFAADRERQERRTIAELRSARQQDKSSKSSVSTKGTPTNGRGNIIHDLDEF